MIYNTKNVEPRHLVYAAIFVILLVVSGLGIEKYVEKNRAIDGPAPVMYRIGAQNNSPYWYEVYEINGERTVYIVGTNKMAPAQHSDGTPVTPEEAGIVLPDEEEMK